MTEIKLAPEDCHNYKQFAEQGRCPLTDVCHEDCVFVWKECYEDIMNNLVNSSTIEDLQDKINSLENEVSELNSEYEEAYARADDFENKYDEVIRDIAKIIKEDSLEKLKEMNLECKIGDWIDDVEISYNFKKGRKDKVIDV